MNEHAKIVGTAKVFWSGRSQAVRLPKEFRFDASEVRIVREGDKVILEPIETANEWVNRLAGTMDEEFAAGALDRPGPETMPDGPSFE